MAGLNWKDTRHALLILFGQRGADLTDASATVTIDGGRRRRLPAGTLTADRTLTLGTTNARTGDIFEVSREDIGRYNYSISAAGGGGTIAVMLPGRKAKVEAQFNGTTWVLLSHSEQVPERAVVYRTGQTASITATNLFSAAPTAGLYLVCVSAECTTAGSAGTLDVTLGYTVNGSARTQTPISAQDLSSRTDGHGVLVLEADGTNNVTYATTVTGATGSPAYSLRMSIQRM